MIRTLFAILTLLMMFAGPGLCVAGLIEHACEDAPPDAASCSHEETCAEDPCFDTPVLPEAGRCSHEFALPVPAHEITEIAAVPSRSATRMPDFLARGKTLPVHESDLPLLS